MGKRPTSGWQGSRWHLYRLRNTAAYRKRNTTYQPTRPTPVPIGERRKPQPQGSPGDLRVDTVHQGGQDGCKSLYHINAVDKVTQWEIVAATPQISELWLLPLRQLPPADVFADDGSVLDSTRPLSPE